ncbi:MAG: class II SORL domain-containing protein [Nitrospinae bacterium]|nr:class II SORL domain-containing protein [Nitrospinota bacterium]
MDTSGLNRREFLRKGAAVAITAALAHALPGAAPARAQDKSETDLFRQINRAKDKNKLQGLELGHVPQIHAPDSIKAGVPFEAEVRVGEKLHEMIPSHYIDWIDLYADDIFLTKFILTPNLTQPVCKIMIALDRSATLRAIEHCNLHGLWEGARPITVTP